MDPIFFMCLSKWLMVKTIFEIGLALSDSAAAATLKAIGHHQSTDGATQMKATDGATQMKAARLHFYRN